MSHKRGKSAGLNPDTRIVLSAIDANDNIVSLGVAGTAGFSNGKYANIRMSLERFSFFYPTFGPTGLGLYERVAIFAYNWYIHGR
jgi:hypothetical protein